MSPAADAGLFARAPGYLAAAAVSSAMPLSSLAMPLSPPAGLGAAAKATRFLWKRFGCFLRERMKAG